MNTRREIKNVCVLASIFFLYVVGDKVLCASDVYVGGIFEGPNKDAELAFEVAIDTINFHRTLPHVTLKPLSFGIEPDDISDPKRGTFIDVTWDNPEAALRIACSILKTGVVGIFTSLSESNADAVQSVCDNKEVPFIQTSFDTEHERECCSINLYPHPSVLAVAFADLVNEKRWQSFVVIYEKEESLPKIAKITSGRNVIIWQLVNENGDYTNSLKGIRRSGQTNFVLDCSIENLNNILEQAQQTGLMMGDYSYIILNLDMHTIDLSPYQHAETNITAFRLVNPSNAVVIETAEALQMKREELGLETEAFGHLAAWKMQTSTSLLVDAVMLFAEVLRDYGKIKAKPLPCNSSNNWEHGFTMFNLMKTKTFEGLTGKIEFDHQGFRTQFTLQAVELTEGGVVEIGTWDSKKGLNMARFNSLSDDDNLRNASFTVVICWAEPYAMLKYTPTKLTGNDQFEGFAIDLIRELASLEGFNYTFVQNDINKNGDYNETTGKWNGMLGDILERRADLAIADLTITRERQNFVDFTEPFMTLGVQILYKKPTKSSPSFFSFAAPFAPDVWMLFTITFFGMSFMFYLIARICPDEWFNPYPCIEEPRYLINQYDMNNCMFLIIANLMQEGADFAPRGASTRVLTSFWSFFVLIMVSTYTANMAAFLTAEKDEWPFTNVRELIKRADKLGIKYGASKNGATHKLFKESQDELYKQIGEYMDTHPDDMVKLFQEGVERVADPDNNYAFFMESSSIKYKTERNCNLTSVGSFLDEKYYGIAMRKNSTYRNRLSAGVLKLKESGIIDDLERKWWEKERGGGQCLKTKEHTGAPPLNYKHVAGIIWITIGGTILACVIVFIELIVYVVKKSGKNRKKVVQLKNELKFYCKFEETTKPVQTTKQNVQCTKEEPNEEEQSDTDCESVV